MTRSLSINVKLMGIVNKRGIIPVIGTHSVVNNMHNSNKRDEHDIYYII